MTTAVVSDVYRVVINLDGSSRVTAASAASALASQNAAASSASNAASSANDAAVSAAAAATSAANSLSVFDYMTVAQIADVQARTFTLDVTAEINAAIADAGYYGHVYLPWGGYRVNDEIAVANGRLEGASPNGTEIVSYNATATDAVFSIGGSAALSNLRIGFHSSVMTGSETRGQRVGVKCYETGAALALQRMGGIYNVLFEDVGTAISDAGQQVFSATFQDIEIRNYSHKGVDFYSTGGRTGNVWSNIYVTNDGTSYTSAVSGFHMEGTEVGCVIDKLNVEWATLDNAIVLEDFYGFVIGNAHFEQVTLRSTYTALLNLNRSAGHIESLSVVFCPITTDGWSVAKVEDSTMSYGTADPNTARVLSIGALYLVGLNDGSQVLIGNGIGSLTDFYIFARLVGETGPYKIEVGQYIWNSYQADTAVYIAFPVDPENRLWVENKFTSLRTVTAATDTLLATDSLVIFNRAGGVTVTLPSAADHPDREVMLVNIAAGAVISASSNVVPQGGGAAETAMLPAIVGKWERLKSVNDVWTIIETGGPASLTEDVTGILPIANGGTGTATPAILEGKNVSVSGTFPAQTINSRLPAAVLQDQKASTTDGGTFTSGAWQTRTLNTEVFDTNNLIALSANEFTPSANGVVKWSAPAVDVLNHQTRLFNVTDTAVVGYGSAEYSGAASGVPTRSIGSALVVSGKAYRIEHQCNTTVADFGFGVGAGFASNTEIFTEVQYWAVGN